MDFINQVPINAIYITIGIIFIIIYENLTYNKKGDQ